MSPESRTEGGAVNTAFHFTRTARLTPPPRNTTLPLTTYAIPISTNQTHRHQRLHDRPCGRIGGRIRHPHGAGRGMGKFAGGDSMTDRAMTPEEVRRAKLRALDRRGFWIGFGIGLLAGMLFFVAAALIAWYIISKWLGSLKE